MMQIICEMNDGMKIDKMKYCKIFSASVVTFFIYSEQDF